jgi:hypothetical protein
MRRFADLHTHSRGSDGDLWPAELVALAERTRLAVLALTDHDTIEGLADGARAARGLGLRFVPGVEISAEFPDGTLHLLGLGVNPASRALEDVLRRLRRSRDQRNPRMLAKLSRLGMHITLEELRRFAGAEGRPEAVVGRLHLANLMRRKGYVASAEEAFGKYIGHGRPAYVDKERLTPSQAIGAIHAAGGVAVLAHPPQLRYRNLGQLRAILSDLVAMGLDGIEVYHPDHTDRQTRWYLDLARRMGLLVAGGSDFHGPSKAQVRLGHPRVPVEAVGQLLARIAR